MVIYCHPIEIWKKILPRSSLGRVESEKRFRAMNDSFLVRLFQILMVPQKLYLSVLTKAGPERTRTWSDFAKRLNQLVYSLEGVVEFVSIHFDLNSNLSLNYFHCGTFITSKKNFRARWTVKKTLLYRTWCLKWHRFPKNMKYPIFSPIFPLVYLFSW